ncbi:MAG TPA: hypothetical protein VGY99_09465 [Candidatus Binataceae bacterium]|nr:hypothetical protein [Candidatus Binataceae bacterium]
MASSPSDTMRMLRVSSATAARVSADVRFSFRREMPLWSASAREYLAPLWVH